MKDFESLIAEVVQGIRASNVRKQAMREELLAHLMSAYEEELRSSPNEDAAAEAARRRFGNTDELRTRLQESVSARDWFQRIGDRIWSRPGESWWRRALRRALLIVVLLPVIPILAWLAAGARIGKAPDAATLGIVVPTVLAILFSALCFTFLAEWMQHALYGPRGRSWIQVGLIVPTCGLLSVIFAYCIWLNSATGWAGVDRVELGMIFGYGLLWIPAALGILAYASDVRMRHDREWAALEIA